MSGKNKAERPSGRPFPKATVKEFFSRHKVKEKTRVSGEAIVLRSIDRSCSITAMF